MALHQVDGDLDFVIDMLQTFCIGAKEQLASCSRAAHACDIATLRSNAHSMKGGAAVCCAMQLTNSCGALERMAHRDLASMSTKADTSAPSSSSKSPEFWTRMVDDISECLDALSCSVNALTSMRTLPVISTLKGVHGEYAVGALSDLLEAAVTAYVAGHAATFGNEECNIGEEPLSVTIAREKLSLACAAATALSVEDLVRTTRLLSEHLASRHLSRSGDTLMTGGQLHDDLFRIQAELKLDDMRVTVESLAVQLALFLGERMPVLAIPFADEEPGKVVAQTRRAEKATEVDESPVASSSVKHLLPEWAGDPICDYHALMQSTGDDHEFVIALLHSFKDSLTIFSKGLSVQVCSLFDARSLHGAAVSMCAPRTVAALSDFIAATEATQHTEKTTDITSDLCAKTFESAAVRASIREYRAAIYQLTRSLHALEDFGIASCPAAR